MRTTGSQADHAALKALVEELGLTAYSINERVPSTRLEKPKLGTYTTNNSSNTTMPEGWSRLRLDRSGWDYTRLYPADVLSGTVSAYNVIILPDAPTSTIINGSPTSTSLPPEYRLGMGSAGVAKLKQFVMDGGTLVLQGRSSVLPIEQNWGISVTVPSAALAAAWSAPIPDNPEDLPDFGGEAPKGAQAAAAPTANCPGSIVRIKVDPATKVGYGYNDVEALWCESSTPYFVPVSGGTAAVVASYPASNDGNLLLSGYLDATADAALRGKAAIVDAPLGAGHVILLAPNVVYRAQTTGTFMFFWNSLIEGSRGGLAETWNFLPFIMRSEGNRRTLMNMPARKRLTRRVGTVLILFLLTALLLGAAGTSAMPNRLPAAPVNAAVTTPRDFFGYDIGQDYKLTPWQTHVLQGEGVRKGIVEYANELQRTSPRVRVFQYGTTEEGRPMIMTVITSPQNWAQINDLKGILKKLADPRQVASDAEAKFLAQRGKAVYWISPAIHATERTSPEVGVRLSYRLASDEDAWTRNLLDNVIVVIEGTLNPDGLEMVTDWYYKYKDTAYANSSPPYYNKYINHDNNRDFLGMGIAETRANTAARFEWNPTLYHDLHQTQNMLFMYPAMDPTNLAVNAITVAEWLGYGGHTLTGLIAKGWTGVFLYDYTDNWYPGYNDIFSFMHNTMGTLYELRGANMATPIVMTATPRGRSWYNPAPYTPGFTWRLMDAVNLEEDAIRLKLGYLAQNKDDLLYNFYLKGKLNYQKSAGEPPYAFMIPANGGDNVDVTDLINNLHLLHRIEVDRLAAPATIAGQQYKAGDYVVRADQPYGLTAKNYLATPPYPGGQTPFDVVSWDYGLLRDVTGGTGDDNPAGRTEPDPGDTQECRTPAP